MAQLGPAEASWSCLQVSQPNGEVVITNDGATILNKMVVTQPAAKMLVELSKSQVQHSPTKDQSLYQLAVFTPLH